VARISLGKQKPNFYNYFLVCGLIDNILFCRWEIVKKDEMVDVIPCKLLQIGNVPLTRLAMSEDGKFIAIGGSDGKVTLVDAESMKSVSFCFFIFQNILLTIAF
jgi:WD40 repeat protein